MKAARPSFADGAFAVHNGPAIQARVLRFLTT